MIKLRAFMRRLIREVKRSYNSYPGAFIVAAVVGSLLSVYLISKAMDSSRTLVRVEREGSFKGQRILGDASSSVYEAKERNFNKTAGELLSGQKKISDDLQKISERVDAIEGKQQTGGSSDAASPSPAKPGDVVASPDPKMSPTLGGGIAIHDSPDIYQSEIVPSDPSYGGYQRGNPRVGIVPTQRRAARGPSIITFPVSSEEAKEELGVVLPPGSYVKGKIIAGAKAKPGEPEPVLIQLDYSHVMPNHKKLDLSGCFITAKAQSDMSSERVKMQTAKIACISKKSRMFERPINGYAVDDGDNLAGVTGPLESKQDRVAAMAFLASVVEGVGKAIQQAQTTQQQTPLGGSQMMVTGDQQKYILAGGGADAAGVVVNWYLKQAENLMPTITAASGKDVWLVLLDSVNLPKDYFKKGAGHDARYEYVTRILD